MLTIYKHILANACNIFSEVLDLEKFLPCDAMLAWYMLSSCLHLSISPFVRHKSEFYQDN